MQAAARRGSRATRLGLAVGLLLLLIGAAQFWLHDAFPYLINYSEAGYRRYWAVRLWLLPHIGGGTIALFAGPFQLWSGFRRRFRRLHRLTGYTYVAGVVLSACFSFYLVFHARADFGLSLFVLAIAWLASTGMALIAVLNKRIDGHREWMIRSYIATFAFVSYRYLVGLSPLAFLGPSRPAMALWISWVIPMMLFELFAQWGRVTPLTRPARGAVAGDSKSQAWS